MRLTVACSACASPSAVAPTARDRLRLAAARGRTFRHACPTCGATETVHVDDVRASPDRAEAFALVAGLLAGAATVASMWYHGWIGTLPVVLFAALYGGVRHRERQKAAAFNRFRVGDSRTPRRRA